MYKLFKSLVLLVAIIPFCFSDDSASYVEGSNFSKVRQVGNQATCIEFSISTTSNVITLPKNALSFTIINDDAANTIYVNPTGSIALNLVATGGYTTAGSNEMDLNTPIGALGLKIGDLIYLNEGDANDGIYSIMRFSNSTNKVYLDRNLTVTHNANQNYTLKSIPIYYGESMSLDIGSSNISLVASAASTEGRLIVSYQKGS